jgi:hypothetical protein
VFSSGRVGFSTRGKELRRSGTRVQFEVQRQWKSAPGGHFPLPRQVPCYLRNTVPPFMTNETRLSTVMSCVGSPGTAITSAK